MLTLIAVAPLSAPAVAGNSPALIAGDEPALAAVGKAPTSLVDGDKNVPPHVVFGQLFAKAATIKINTSPKVVKGFDHGNLKMPPDDPAPEDKVTDLGMAELTKDDDGGYIERIKTVEKEYPDLEAALRNLDKEHDSGDNYGNKTDIMLLKPDVQGFDDRDRVTNCGARHDTRTVVAIASSYSWAYCTGTLIAPDVVLTAGHCIYEDGAWNWPQHIFIHACGASDTTRRYSAKQMFTWTRWTRNEDPNWDIGVIKLHPSGGRHAGDRYGWKSFGYVSDIASALSRPRVTGYPGDKQRSVERLSMWSDEDRYSSSSRAHHLVFYRTDTSGANSGSGVHQNGRSVIYAVHAYGDTPDNAGVRIRSGIFSQICSWISNRRVC